MTESTQQPVEKPVDLECEKIASRVRKLTQELIFGE
jgi:hypothetical protein